jgi:hypothetical protein
MNGWTPNGTYPNAVGPPRRSGPMGISPTGTFPNAAVIEVQWGGHGRVEVSASGGGRAVGGRLAGGQFGTRLAG